MNERTFSKKMLIITILISLLVCVPFLTTFAWFSDTKSADLTISPVALNASATVTQDLPPSDLVANGIFTKTLNIKFTAGFDLYFRTYVVAKMNTNSGVREDLITLTSVSNAKKATDSKFYYQISSNVDENNLTRVNAQTTEQTISLNYTFKVDSSVSSALFVTSSNSSTTTISNNTTTLTFHIEYCQVEGVNDWVPVNSGFGETSESYLLGNWAEVLSTGSNSVVVPEKIKTITFSSAQPTSFDGSCSVGTDSETSTTAYTQSDTVDDVTAYWKESTETSGTYDVTLYSPATIFAPQDSTGLFALAMFQTDESASLVLDQIDFGSNFNTSKATNMMYMFAVCTLKSLDLSSFDTSNVTNMEGMFMGLGGISNLDLSSFDTSKVTNMSMMFSSSLSLVSIELSNFDVRNVTNMAGMFSYCMVLETIDLSKWKTDSLEVISEESAGSGMFYLCYKLKSLDLSNFNTSKVTDMTGLFNALSSLTSLKIDSFDTSNVTNMNYMFAGCYFLDELDVGSFDTSKVTNMTGMFISCNGLKNLDLSTFDMSIVTSADDFLTYCNALKTLNAPKAINSTLTLALPLDFKISGSSTIVTEISISNGTIGKTLENEDEKITIYFNAMGGECNIQSTTATVGKEFVVPNETIVSKEGCTFGGWWTDPTGGTQVTSSTTLTESQTLYAHWTSA